jgi:uroporphyrinogen decarboxylase
MQLIQGFESSGGELSPASFKQFSQPYLQYIAKHLPIKLQELGLEPVPMIVFPKGQWYALDAACDMGYNVVGLDWLHDPAEAVKTVGDRPVVIQGNADPGVLYGSHESITEVVNAMVKGFDWANRRSGWIVNLGHGKFRSLPLVTNLIHSAGITPFVNPEDLRFFFEEVHRLTKILD